MVEIEFQNTLYQVLEYIHQFKREKGRVPRSYEITNDEERLPGWKDLELKRGDIEKLAQSGILEKTSYNTKTAYDLGDEGLEYLSNIRLIAVLDETNEINDKMLSKLQNTEALNIELKNHQKRSTAAETLFTIALLTFAFIQSLNIVGLGLKIVLTVVYLGVIFLALMIGGKTLLDVVKADIGENR
jgi:hypothetical protein